MRQIQIGFENRQDLVISKSIVPGRRPAPVQDPLLRAASDVPQYRPLDGVASLGGPECHRPRISALATLRGSCGCVIFHEPRMALPAPRRLAIEIALHERTDFGFGLRQRYDVGTSIQLPLCIPADDLVLPEGESL